VSASDIPTIPAGALPDIRFETTKTMPKIPNGFLLKVVVETYSFGHAMLFRRVVRTQAHLDMYHTMATHPEITSIVFYWEPIALPRPKPPDLSDVLWDNPFTKVWKGPPSK